MQNRDTQVIYQLYFSGAKALLFVLAGSEHFKRIIKHDIQFTQGFRDSLNDQKISIGLQAKEMQLGGLMGETQSFLHIMFWTNWLVGYRF